MASNTSATDVKKAPVWIAIYTRKSNDENLTNNVTSIDSQKSCCRSYIEIQKEKGWQEYPETFDDPAESGKDFKRPAVKRLLKTIAEGKVQGVIVYKLDRMTRNSKDFHSLLELFEKYNVAFVSATESIDTKSPQGRLMTAIMVQFAQYDRELDQERSRDFHLARASKGLWCGGVPPLGYDVKDKLLVVNNQEAELVRRIFDLYLKHESAMAVAEDLNRQGFRRKVYTTKNGRTAGGRLFNLDSIIRTLRRKAYIGIITNGRSGKEFSGQHKAIMGPEIFEQAQKILNEHVRRDGQITYKRNKYGFRLKRLIRCAECGSAVTSYVRPKKNKVYRYYRCLAIQNGLHTPCAFKSVRAEKLDEYVIEKLAAVGWDKKLIERTVRKIRDLTKDGLKWMEREKRGVNERLRETCRGIENLIRIAKGEGASKEASEELRRLETIKRELEAKLTELEANIGFRAKAVYDADVIAGALQRFARFIYRLPMELQIQAIRLLVKQVIVGKEGIKVLLHDLPVADLDKALNEKEGGAESEKFKSRRSLKRLESNTTTKPDNSQQTDRIAVAESLAVWRPVRDSNP